MNINIDTLNRITVAIKDTGLPISGVTLTVPHENYMEFEEFVYNNTYPVTGYAIGGSISIQYNIKIENKDFKFGTE